MCTVIPWWIIGGIWHRLLPTKLYWNIYTIKKIFDVIICTLMIFWYFVLRKKRAYIYNIIVISRWPFSLTASSLFVVLSKYEKAERYWKSKEIRKLQACCASSCLCQKYFWLFNFRDINRSFSGEIILKVIRNFKFLFVSSFIWINRFILVDVEYIFAYNQLPLDACSSKFIFSI